MYSITRNVFFIPSYAIGAKEMEKIDKLFNIFKKSGVFDLIDDVYSKEYHKGGRPLIDRHKLIVLIAYAYAFRHTSLRDMETFCKFDLRAINIMDGTIPSHTSIGKFYNEFIVPNRDSLFSKITDAIRDECNIDFNTAFLDGSKFEADANKYKFVWKPTKYHQKLSDKIRIILSKYELSRNVPETGIIPAATIADKITKFNNLISNIDISDKSNKEIFKDYEFLKSALIKSLEYEEKEKICGPDRNSYYKTDHDATAMCLKRDYYSGLGTNTHAAYNTQIIVCKGLIATYYVSQSRSDLKDLIPALDKFYESYSIYPKYLCADSGYGSLNNYRYLHDHNIGNYVKYFSWEGNISGRNPSQYVLINETAIRCLNGNIGHIVKLDNRHPKKSNSTFFRIDGCNSCDFKDYCKRWMNKKEENFKIFEVVIELQKYINQSEENLLSPKGIELRVNRSIQVEGTFGMIKQDMPFDRFTRTSLDKVSTEFMMVCLGLNIRKLFKFYDAKSKNKFWIAPNDLQPETKKKPSAKRLSNKVNRKKLKKEADEPNPKG